MTESVVMFGATGSAELHTIDDKLIKKLEISAVEMDEESYKLLYEGNVIATFKDEAWEIDHNFTKKRLHVFNDTTIMLRQLPEEEPLPLIELFKFAEDTWEPTEENITVTDSNEKTENPAPTTTPPADEHPEQ